MTGVHPMTSIRGTRSVKWLAFESNVAEITVARIEAGLNPRPNRETWNKLAKALDANPSDLELAHVEFVNSQREAA